MHAPPTRREWRRPSALFVPDSDGATRVPRLHGRSCAILLAALTGGLSGCAGGAPGPAPSSTAAGVTGSIAPAHYELTPDERAWDCPRLTDAIEQALPDLAGLTERAAAERRAPPASLARAVARAVGEADQMLPSQLQLDRARDRLDGYNAALAARGCQSVDIDARIAALQPGRPPPAAFAPETQTDLDRSIDLPSIEPADLRL